MLVQVVIQDPKSGQQYVFELKDRLIRDSECDGWIEIPVKPENDGHADEDSQNTSGTAPQVALHKLPGMFAQYEWQVKFTLFC